MIIDKPIRSPLKLKGGKFRAVKILSQFIPRDIECLVSPFVGSGVLELNIAHHWKLPVHAYDHDHRIVDFFKVWKKSPEALTDVAREIAPVTDDHDEAREIYHRVREDFLTWDDPVRRAGGFFVVSRLAFDGNIGGGEKWCGLHTRNDFTPSLFKRLRQGMPDGIEIKHADFQESLERHNGSSFTYLDPPYFNTVNDWYYAGHAEFDHLKLHEMLADRPQWIMSYDDSPDINELYRDHRILRPQWKWGRGGGGYYDGKELLIFSKDLDPEEILKEKGITDPIGIIIKRQYRKQYQKLNWGVVRNRAGEIDLDDYDIPEFVRKRRNSPLRWVGGKSKAAKDLFRLRPKGFRHFCEPFAGSAAMSFFVRRRLVGNPADFKFTISDVNSDLIHFFKQLQRYPEQLSEMILAFPSPLSLAQFKSVKGMLDKSDGIERAAAFYVINRNSYGGYQLGTFDHAKKRNLFSTAISSELPAFGRLLNKFRITNQDYQACWARVEGEGRECWVFLDPPYSMQGTDYSYSKSEMQHFYKHHLEDYEAFAQKCHETQCNVMVTIDDTDTNRKLFHGLNIIQRHVRYTSHKNQGSKKHRPELVVTNYDVDETIIEDLDWEIL